MFRPGARAVADYGRRGGWTVRTPKVQKRLTELSEKGLGPRAAHAAGAKQASYGTVYKVHRQWSAGRSAPSAPRAATAPAQPALSLVATSDEANVVEEAAPAALSAPAPTEATSGEPTLEDVAPPAGTVVQHVGSWLLLGGLRDLGFYDLAAQHRGEVPGASLRAAIALGEGSVEGVRRLETTSVDTLLRAHHDSQRREAVHVVRPVSASAGRRQG